MIKELQGFGNKYFVSDDGFVYNDKNKKLRPSINRKTGYCQVILTKDGCQIMRYVHRLVAEAFLENPNQRKEVNHKDGNKQNNSASNLEWATRSENMSHAYKSGLRKTTCVSAFTKTGEFVKTFSSEKEAMEFCGVDYNAGISNCLIGKTKTAYGYVWKYAEVTK